MLYFSADPFCRNCVGGARRAWITRIAVGVAGVMVLMTLVTGVMLSAIPSSIRTRATDAALIPIRHVENCRPFDQWLAEARRDLERGRPHNALHDASLSRRDCAAYDVERDRIEALAYATIGDKFAAIAAIARFADGSDDEATSRLRAAVQELLDPSDEAINASFVTTN